MHLSCSPLIWAKKGTFFTILNMSMCAGSRLMRLKLKRHCSNKLCILCKLSDIDNFIFLSPDSPFCVFALHTHLNTKSHC